MNPNKGLATTALDNNTHTAINIIQSAQYLTTMGTANVLAGNITQQYTGVYLHNSDFFACKFKNLI